MRHLLWIDDEADSVLRPLKKMLEDDFTVDVATDVETALERMKGQKYDSFLIDVIFDWSHDLAGIRLAERILEERKGGEVPIVTFLSIIRQEELTPELKRLGATFFNKMDLLDAGRVEELRQVLQGKHKT